ncbi:MAG: peptide MFS transporter [Kordiimonadaceae bacterium]|jgi:proton-dependent oligopeptide transporter, POT family|nr:peptide MFS transporter [Kordiimonadaceae bacterium]MBT6035567.1 peptide MFS transporter [Kordiimonadaceae bacterium]MBT6329325.1 peptide MFS transporter [Kordiimonadaceae bacterium]MBT7582732.1 peptide MFS transporter [Kordiimonadaceae bacterium]
MSDYSDEIYAGSQKRNFMGHPIGLSVLFFTEMWERFSYYGMRTILILYLTKYHLFGVEKASMIYGAYAGMVYMMPIIGGYMADRYLGSRKAVTYGAILLVAGHGLMAVHGPAAYMSGDIVVRDEFYINIFFLALALIIGGTGFLKANISSVVGALYGPSDPRRDGGFSIFYMGINLGAFISMIVVGYVGETYGWNYGFSIAGIGMFFGLMVFLWGQKFLGGRAEPSNPAILKEKSPIGLNKENTIYLFGLGLVGVSWVMMQYDAMVIQAVGIAGLFMIGFILYYAYSQCEKVDRERLFVALFLIAIQSVFWALFEQQAASLTLLADQQYDLNFLGMNILASQVQTMNALFIITLAPVMAWLWLTLSRKNWEPSTPAKFGYAMLIIGAGYIVFSWSMTLDDSTSKSFLWLIYIYFMLTLAELFLSPVGLSMVTKLSVPKIVGMMMGTWFLFTALGNNVAGWISSMMGSNEVGAASGTLDLSATMELYTMIGLVSAGVGVLILVLTPLLKKGMHGVH